MSTGSGDRHARVGFPTTNSEGGIAGPPKISRPWARSLLWRRWLRRMTLSLCEVLKPGLTHQVDQSHIDLRQEMPIPITGDLAAGVPKPP